MILDSAVCAAPVSQFTTDNVPASDRAGYWADIVGSYFGPASCRPVDADSVDATLTVRNFGFLQFFAIDAGAHHIRHEGPPRGAHGDMLKLLLQLDGRTRLEGDNGSTELGPGGWCLVDPTASGAFTNLSPVRQIVVKVPRMRMAKGAGAPPNGAFIADPRHTAMARVLPAFVESFAFDGSFQDDAYAAYLAETTIGLLCCALQSADDRHAGDRASTKVLLTRAKHFIANNLADPELSIDRIAAAMGCSKRYLHVAFEQEGTTIQRHIWHLRIEQCRRALADEAQAHKSVSEIAFDWGFNDATHFGRLFKANVGVLPTSYRREAMLETDPRSADRGRRDPADRNMP